MDVRVEDAHDAAFEEIDLSFDLGESFGIERGDLGEVVGLWGFGFRGLVGDELGDWLGDFPVGEEGGKGELDFGFLGVGGGVEEGFAGFGGFGGEFVGLDAGEFEDFSVLNAAGAGGFAGSAAQAGVEGGGGVLVPGGGGGVAGEGDAPAGGLALVGRQLEGRTGLEAEAASDALGSEVFELGHGVEGTWGRGGLRCGIGGQGRLGNLRRCAFCWACC